MARFPSPLARPFRRTHLHCFERFFTNRCEEVNNYSGWMTRSFCDGSSRFAYRRVDTRRDRSVQHRIAGCVQMDTVDGEMFGHGRQSDKAGSGLWRAPAGSRCSCRSSHRLRFHRHRLVKLRSSCKRRQCRPAVGEWSAETWLVKIKRLTAAAACSHCSCFAGGPGSK